MAGHKDLEKKGCSSAVITEMPRIHVLCYKLDLIYTRLIPFYKLDPTGWDLVSGSPSHGLILLACSDMLSFLWCRSLKKEKELYK